MSLVTIPYRPVAGSPEDIAQIIADFDALTAVINGLLEAGVNFKVDAPSTITGKDNTVGSSDSAARADHGHIVQGVENVAALPTTGLFLGRVVLLTTDNKHYSCTDATGTGTWEPYSNLAPADVVIHGVEHKDAGHDPLPSNILTDHMKAARTIASVIMGATVNSVSTASYTTIADLPVSTDGLQTLLVIVHYKATNVHATNKPSVACRVQDITAPGSPTIFRSGTHQLGAAGGGADSADLTYAFYYTVPAPPALPASQVVARTLRLQVGSDIADVNVIKPGTFNGDSFAPSQLMAVIV